MLGVDPSHKLSDRLCFKLFPACFRPGVLSFLTRRHKAAKNGPAFVLLLGAEPTSWVALRADDLLKPQHELEIPSQSHFVVGDPPVQPSNAALVFDRGNLILTMNLKLVLLSLFGLILIPSSVLIASEVRIDDLVVTLPEGYRHEPKSGDDSSVGVIHTKEPILQIKYDIGVMAGGRFGLVNMLKHDLAAVVYFEEISLGDLQAYFIAFRIGDSPKKRRLFLKIPSVRAHLSVDLDDPSAIAGAKNAFQRIQYRKFLQK